MSPFIRNAIRESKLEGEVLDWLASDQPNSVDYSSTYLRTETLLGPGRVGTVIQRLSAQ